MLMPMTPLGLVEAGAVRLPTRLLATVTVLEAAEVCTWMAVTHPDDVVLEVLRPCILFREIVTLDAAFCMPYRKGAAAPIPEMVFPEQIKPVLFPGPR